MIRREFVTLLGGAAVWPIAAQAQQSAMPVIGFMSGRSRVESTSVVNSFRRGLAETGYSEGRNVVVEYSWADGQYDRLPKMAKDLVDRQVAVIAATGSSVSGLAAKAATIATPIVFSSGGDAITLGLVPSLNRPGGNVTGVNLIFGALGAKRLELLHEFIPSARSIAMLVNLRYPSAANEVQDVQGSAKALGLTVETYNAPVLGDFEGAFAAMVQHKMAGVLVADDPFLQSRRDQHRAADPMSAQRPLSRDIEFGGVHATARLHRSINAYGGFLVSRSASSNLSVAVVPYAAGGTFDVMGRILAARMGEFLNQPVIVENTTGAGGIIGVTRVINAAPDGYTVLLGSTGTHAYNQTIYKKRRYDAINDFTPVALFSEQPMVLEVRKDLPASTIPEFIALLKANAGKMQYGSAGAKRTSASCSDDFRHTVC